MPNTMTRADMEPTSAVYLVDVVEVDKENRILCQADGCGHSVYAAIHIVLQDGKFTVLGGDCFKRLFGASLQGGSSYYGGSIQSPTILTEEMRELLATNTVGFIEQLELHRQELEAQASEVKQGIGATQAAARRHRATQHRPIASGPSEPGFSSAMAEAKKKLRRIHPGVNLDSAGWSGLVKIEARQILRDRMAQVKNDDD